MDPNTILPSPPSSIYSSLPTSPTAADSFSRRASTTPATPQLPFPEVRRIMGFAQEELEAVSFAILEARGPEHLSAKDIDCADGVELNWACRQLPPYCPENMAETLNDWLPDIRHAFVHRYRFSALAACKTMYEAAVFAKEMGYPALGARFETIAKEMDWCRLEMMEKGEEEECKIMVSERLQGVLKAARKEKGWVVRGGGGISKEVRGYTFEQKLEENGWADPRAWGQDRNRRYRSTSGSRSPPGLVDKVDSWRASSGNGGSSTNPTSGGSSERAPAQNSSRSAPARLSPNGEEGDFWSASKSGNSASNASERPSAQRTSSSPPNWRSSGVDRVDLWKAATSGNLSSSNSTPSKVVPKSSEKSPAQNNSKAYVPPARRAGMGSNWTRQK
ncbi:MAG: hypothetical protein Q9195_009451 [Heterodermia aff. obscurata]